MPIQADCSSCGHSFQASSKYAGKKVKCPECKEPLTLPAAKSKAKASSKKNAAKITLKCKCGQKFNAKAELAGKKIKCPKCEQPIRVPAGNKIAKAKPPTQEASIGDLFDEVGFNTEDGSAHRKCPECRAPMTDEAIICIDCGYNENTGKRMETYRPLTAADRAKRMAKPDRPAGAQKGAGGKLPMILGGVVLVALLAVAGWYFTNQ